MASLLRAVLLRPAFAVPACLALVLATGCPTGPTDAGPEVVCPETSGALDPTGDSITASIVDNGELVIDLDLEEARGVVLSLAFQGANEGATLNASIFQGCGEQATSVAQAADVTAARPLVAALDAGHYYVAIVGQTIVGQVLFNLELTSAPLDDDARCEHASAAALPSTVTVSPTGGGPAPACAPPSGELNRTFVEVELPAGHALLGTASTPSVTASVLESCDDATCDEDVLLTDAPTLLTRNETDTAAAQLVALGPDVDADVSLTSVPLPTNLSCDAAEVVDLGGDPLTLTGDHGLGGDTLSCPDADLPQLVLTQYFEVEVPVGGILSVASTTSAVTVLETCASPCTLGAEASESEFVNLTGGPVDVVVAVGGTAPGASAWDLTLSLGP